MAGTVAGPKFGDHPGENVRIWHGHKERIACESLFGLGSRAVGQPAEFAAMERCGAGSWARCRCEGSAGDASLGASEVSILDSGNG